MIQQTTIDKAIGVAVAVAAAVQSILVTQGVETADLAAQITTGLAGVLTAYHGGTAIQSASATIKAAQADTAPVIVPVAGSPATPNGPADLS
jgi:hypothetical protein